MSDIGQKDIRNILSQIFYLLPNDIQEAFKLSNPVFEYISASFNMEKSIKRGEEFRRSIPNQIPDFSASSHLFQLSNKELSTNMEEKISKALRLINSRTCKSHKKLSRDDLLYLVRVWGFFSEKSDELNIFYQYFPQDLENVLMTNPLKKIDTYQGMIFHFRADTDMFKIKKGICIRRLYPWEYSESSVEILQMRTSFKIPALKTLAETNFILEVNSDVLKSHDEWAHLHDLRGIVDIISVEAKGHVWIPLFINRKKGLIQWNEGIKGKDFSGLVGIVSGEQTSTFINRVRMGMKLRTNTVFKSVCRSLRQEEEDYGFEFRLVRLFSSLEMLLGSPGVGCGMKLAWLLGKDPTQRKNIFKYFKSIKDLRDNIIHQVLLYDLMTSKEQSNTLRSIDKSHDWLFDVLTHFLDRKLSLEDWQMELNGELFGG
ncbi:MAG: hypothetical protein KKI07_00660 [Euryarchaeota archaeon]|nr:hypothetical protein [Euryarchaeota archaeon]